MVKCFALFDNNLVRGGLLILAIFALLAFGVVGIGRGGAESNFDMRYFYVAGKCWLDSANPYDVAVHNAHATDFERFDSEGFAYPPQIAPLCMLLAALPWAVAKPVMTLINLLCVGALAFYCVLLSRRPDSESRPVSDWRPWLIAILVIGNPFSAHVLWMGQTSLIASAALVAAWYYWRSERPVVAGILFAIASIKPQLLFLTMLWVLLERQYRVLAVAAAAALVLSLWPMITQGIFGAFTIWLEAVREYQDSPYTSVEFRHVFGVPSLLASLGWTPPNLMPVAALLLVAFWYFRSRFESANVLAIICAGSVLFVYAHDYDLVILAPLIGPFYNSLNGLPWKSLGSLVLLAGLCTPLRLVRRFAEGPVLRYREVILLLLFAWLVQLSWKGAPGGHESKT